MGQMLFVTNELMNPQMISKMKIPMEFIGFGITDGRMYYHYKKHSTFVVPNETLKLWGNTKVYGALFLCKDYHFYSRIIDAYHACSKSIMMKNHNKDIHHRVNVEVTPIYFNTLEELARLKYREGNSIDAKMYMGNIEHDRISQRLGTTISYRIIDGIDKENFVKLWEEQQHGF